MSRCEVYVPEVCRVGEIVLIGGQEAKTVVTKGSLIFRFPLERDYPEGTAVRPLTDDAFLQAEGDQLCLYRKGAEGIEWRNARKQKNQRMPYHLGSEAFVADHINHIKQKLLDDLCKLEHLPHKLGILDEAG